MKKAIVINDDTSKQNYKDLSETIKKDQSLLKNNFIADLEFIKKHSEGKFLFLEQKIENTQKSLNIYPTAEEVDQKINLQVTFHYLISIYKP